MAVWHDLSGCWGGCMISCNGRGACIRAYIFCICYYFFVIGIEFILADPHFLKKRYVSEFSPSKKKKVAF